MSNQHKHDLEGLEKKIGSLSKTLHDLSDKDDFEELIRIMKRPGWTTPAEFILAHGIVESMHQIGTSLLVLKADLLKGCGAVSASKSINV